jgi:hypothetical protein
MENYKQFDLDFVGIYRNLLEELHQSVFVMLNEFGMKFLQMVFSWRATQQYVLGLLPLTALQIWRGVRLTIFDFIDPYEGLAHKMAQKPRIY